MPGLTQKQYARRRNVTPQYVNKLVREGKITLGRDGKINAAKADKALEGYRRVARSSKAADAAARKKPRKRAVRASVESEDDGEAGEWRRPQSATSSLTSVRVAHETFKAKLAKLEYQKASGELVPRDQVLKGEQAKNANIRMQFRRLPRNLAPMLARLASAADVEALLLEEIDRVLVQLAGDPLGEVAADPVPEVVAEPEASFEPVPLVPDLAEVAQEVTV